MPRAIWLSPSDQIYDSISAQCEKTVKVTYRVFPLDESISAEGHAICHCVGLVYPDCRILAPIPFAMDLNSAKSNMVVCDIC